MDTEGGGWAVIQRRESGAIDFYRDYKEYVEGFGYLDHEFWLGLSSINRIINARESNELLIELADFDGNSAYARYLFFKVGDNSTEYKLTVLSYNSSSTANDGLSQSNNMKFSTKDKDNDQLSDSNCAATVKGAFWYNKCSKDANLNGEYKESAAVGKTSVSWFPWKNSTESLKFVEIKIRPGKVIKDCTDLRSQPGSASGVYVINRGDESFNVSCTAQYNINTL